jgi:hypothetical protein
MPYYAHISQRGPIRDRDLPGSIGVHEKPEADDLPVGIAHSFTSDDAGLAVWRLVVRGEDVPGSFVIMDRQFIPAHETGRRPRG